LRSPRGGVQAWHVGRSTRVGRALRSSRYDGWPRSARSAFDGDEDVYRAVEAGAQGYLLKDADANDRLQAVRAVHEGRLFVPPAVDQRLVERTLAGPPLTPRELEVLKLVAVGNRFLQCGGCSIYWVRRCCGLAFACAPKTWVTSRRTGSSLSCTSTWNAAPACG